MVGAATAARAALGRLVPLLLLAGLPAPARAASPGAAALLAEGDAAFSRGEFSGSIRHYTDAIDADPSQALFFTKRAAAYMSLRQHSAALRDLDAAIEKDGAFTQGYLHRGKLQRCAAWWCLLSSVCLCGDGCVYLHSLPSLHIPARPPPPHTHTFTDNSHS
jgi:tetratricopeptide (TPR) repeat protein